MPTLQEEAIRLVNKIRKAEKYNTYRLFKRQLLIDLIGFALSVLSMIIVMLTTQFIEVANIMIAISLYEGLRMVHSMYQCMQSSYYRKMQSHFSAEDEEWTKKESLHCLTKYLMVWVFFFYILHIYYW